MTTMVEKVAQAIADNITAGLPDGVEIDARYAALAAIEAMMEPTETMLMAGVDVGVVNETQDIYSAMIRAALEEKR